MAGDGTVVVEDVGSSGRVLLMVGDVLEVLAWAWVGFALHWCWKMVVAIIVGVGVGLIGYPPIGPMHVPNMIFVGQISFGYNWELM